MPRDLPLGNGTLLLNFDSTYQLRDFYYPHVGKENHSTGGPFRFGMWTENNFRWITDDRWSRSLDYEDALVTRVQLAHPDLALRLVCNDAVDFHENLYLRRIDVTNNVPGNPWFVCTLWLAAWHIAIAKSAADLKPALEIFHWVSQHALPSGVLAEQVHPYTDAPLSVSPLTWSHAALVTTVLEYLDKRSELDLCPTCGNPRYSRELGKLRDEHTHHQRFQERADHA